MQMLQGGVSWIHTRVWSLFFRMHEWFHIQAFVHATKVGYAGSHLIRAHRVVQVCVSYAERL